MNILLYLSLILSACSFGECVNVTVDTPVGTYIGFKKNVTIDGSAVEIATFLGIPYAEPPVGDLRFQKPVPKSVLQEPTVVQEYGSECIEIEMVPSIRVRSEDCLFLNIFAPERIDSNDSLAVMIWTHGGGYGLGSSNAYVADLLSARGNVIVVTINYRLNVFGFLYFENNDHGNFGLWDQHLAIKWVHDNIGAFGGDNRRVTIFGQSAGAGSVIYQGIYPGNRGLFQRIIAQSGTASAPWSRSLNPKAEAEKLARLVGCKMETAYKTIECLRRLPVANISAAINDFRNNLFYFTPSQDKEFCTMPVEKALNVDFDGANGPRSVFASFDLMMGVDSAEVGGLLQPLFGVTGDPNTFLPNRTFYEDVLLPISARYKFGNDAPHILTEAIRLMYTAWEDPENPVAVRDRFINMWDDIYFLVSVSQTIDLYANISRKDPYMYLFNANPSTHLLPTPAWVNKPVHGDEMVYIFGEVKEFAELGNIGDFQDWEKELSKTMMNMWSNFAKTGNPNAPRDVEIIWQPYTQAHRKYLEINKELNSTITKGRLREQEINLWNSFLPSLKQYVTPAKCESDTGTSGGSSTICDTMAFVNICIMAVLSLFCRK